LLLPLSAPRRAIDLARERGSILLSSELLLELSDVLSRDRFRRYVDSDVVRRFLFSLARESTWIEVTTRVEACRDPKDDKFLSLAISGHATRIVTGDLDLLSMHPFRGIDIVNPRTFVDQAKRQDVHE
jgi:putative PIN family toxin of toxin-antitoxin system